MPNAPYRFWMLCDGETKGLYTTLEGARAGAERLAQQLGKPIYVLEARDRYTPPSEPGGAWEPLLWPITAVVTTTAVATEGHAWSAD